MTWDKSKQRWKKLYKGGWHRVTCTELGCPPTKEDSYQAANAWWQKRLAEVNRTVELTSPSWFRARVQEQLERRRDWARDYGDDALAEAVGRSLEHFHSHPEIPAEALKERYLPYGLLWSDRFARSRTGPAVPSDRSVGGLIDRYLAGEQARVASGGLSVPAFANCRRSLLALRDWAGADTAVADIDVDRWEQWWLHLLRSDLAIETKRKALNHSRAFIEWASGMGLMSPPSNLHSRRHRFNGGARAVPTMAVADVHKLIDAAPGQLKMHLLLMCNCGMSQQDISDLAPSEIDWEAGRIRRKRSKTATHDAVPVVEYQLWPLAVELLRRYGHRTGDHALLTESGRPWVRDEIKPDGTRHRVDAVRSNYAHVAKRLKMSHPMKLIRKTSATLLASHPIHGRFDVHFLGHSPRSVADRHYVRPDQSLFDEAVQWLGQQYGF
jgi:integrase